MIPLMHKDDAGMRSHYQTIHLRISPTRRAEDEVVDRAWCLGRRASANHRIGERGTRTLKEMGHDVDNPGGGMTYDSV